MQFKIIISSPNYFLCPNCGTLQCDKCNINSNIPINKFTYTITNIEFDTTKDYLKISQDNIYKILYNINSEIYKDVIVEFPLEEDTKSHSNGSIEFKDTYQDIDLKFDKLIYIIRKHNNKSITPLIYTQAMRNINNYIKKIFENHIVTSINENEFLDLVSFSINLM